MTFSETIIRYSRLGLILAAFALASAIIAQPLWQKMWAPGIPVSESSQIRIR